jgi:flagellar biosynthesis protein FlhG
MGRGRGVIDQAQRLRVMAADEKKQRPAAAENTRKTRGPNDENAAKPAKSIAVVSGKGGVGKTNVSIMLGIALSALGKKILLFDADLGLANAHILLGLAPRKNLSHVAAGECALADIVQEGPGGLRLIPGASGQEFMANLDPLRMAMLQHALVELEAGYDYIIIDTAAGISAMTTQFAAPADLGVCVLSPEPASLADAYSMVKVLFERGMKRIDVAVNMASDEDDGKSAFDRLQALVVKFLDKRVRMLGVLPYDRDVPKLMRRQKLLLLEKPGANVSMRISAMARTLLGMPPSAAKRPFFARLFGKKE